MIAIIYGRVSTEEQARRGYSLPEQLLACRNRATLLGATQILAYTDDCSGDLTDRPGLNAAREMVRQGGVRWFICYDPDRFSRQLVHQLLVTQELEQAQVELLFIQHHYERTPEGQLFYAMRGAISQFEKAKILERTQRGKRGKMRRGGIASYVDIYGYRYLTGKGELQIDEREAPWVQQIFCWFTEERCSIRGIVARLHESGLSAPRGNRWHRSTIQRILRNEAYIGRLYMNRYDTTGRTKLPYGADRGPAVRLRAPDQWIAIAVPPLISTEQFDRAATMLVQARHQREPHGEGHLLSGLLICGRCGAALHYKNNRRWARYLCCAHRYVAASDDSAIAPPRCTLPCMRADRVEAHVWQAVRGWLLAPDVVARALQQHRARPQGDGAVEATQHIARQIEIAEKERSHLIYLFTKELIPREEGEQLLRDLGLRLARLHERQQALIAEANPCASSSPFSALTEEAQAIAQEIDALSSQDRRHLIRMLVQRIVISDKAAHCWEIRVSGL